MQAGNRLEGQSVQVDAYLAISGTNLKGKKQEMKGRKREKDGQESGRVGGPRERKEKKGPWGRPPLRIRFRRTHSIYKKEDS